MPTRNVNLTDELERFVLAKVESGQYENASEVVRAALRTLDREDKIDQARLEALRAALPSMIARSPAGNVATYTRCVEAGYLQFWQTHCAKAGLD